LGRGDRIGLGRQHERGQRRERLMRGDAAFRGRDRQLGGNRKAA
jgi:hypothetical protein